METLICDVNNAYMLVYQKAAEQPGEQPAVCVPPPPPPAADVPSPTEKTPTQHKAKEAADTTTQNSTQDEMYFKDLLRKRDAILNTKLDDRSLAERAQYKRLADQIKKLKDKFPCINVKPKSKARPSAERKAASRQNPANRKKERESDRERKAADEAKTKTAARMGNEKNKAKTAL